MMTRKEQLKLKRQLIRELRLVIRDLHRYQDDAEFIAINIVEDERAEELHAYSEACESAIDILQTALQLKVRR